jgi:hypothetical protein
VPRKDPTLGFLNLLTPGLANAKTAKDSDAFEAVIMHLSPANIAHRNTVCAWSTEGCRGACLNTSGRARVKCKLTAKALNKYMIHSARMARTRLYWNRPAVFFKKLYTELGRLERRAKRRGLQAVARLNGTSDVPWEAISPGLFKGFPSIVFYDYTKGIDRALASVLDTSWPSNYHITYSRSELDRGEVSRALAAGVNVAVVFADFLPDFYLGAPVIDGNLNDWRFRDPKGVIVGLTAKARATRRAALESGFVIEPCGPCDRHDPHGPRHDGSPLCRNALKSIAAGGTVAHCTCNACF